MEELDENRKELEALRKQLREEVNKRKLCEHALLRKENFTDSFLASVNSGLAVIDKKGNVGFTNPAFLKLFGISDKSTIKNLFDSDWDRWQVYTHNYELLPFEEHPVRKAAITGKHIKDQLVGLRPPSGEEMIWMLISAEPLMTANGKPDRIICTFNDVSELKFKETALQKSEQILSALYNSMREGFAIYDTVYNSTFKIIDYIIIEMNVPFEKIFGFDSSCIGKRVSEIFGSEKTWFSDLFKKNSNSGMSESFEGYFPGIGKHLKITAFSVLNGKVTSVVEDITERRESEEALKKSETRFRTVLDNSRDILYSLNQQTGQMEYISPSFQTIFGYSVEDCRTMNIESAASLVHPEDLIIFSSTLTERETTGRGELEYRLRDKNGKYHWVSDHMTVINDEDGQPLFKNGNIRDITEQIRAGKELLESQERFRTAFEDGAVAMSIVTTEGRLIKVNDAFCKLTKYSRDILENMKFQDLIHPDDLEISLNEFKRLLSGEISSFRMEKRYIRKDDKIIWGDLSTTAVRNENGEIRHLLIYIQNITKSKNAELELKKSQDKYKELVDNARSIIIKQDPAGIITFFNEYAQKIFGYSEGEIVGRNAYGTIVPEKDSKGNHMKQMLKNIYKDPDKYEININENIKRNGERIIVEWYNKALFDEDGTRSGHMSVGVDITARLNAEKELQESKDKLEVALEIGHIGILEWDLKKNVVVCDERMEEMMNCRSEQHIQRYEVFEKCINEEDLPHFKNAINQTLESGLPAETIFRTRPENGECRFISTKSFITKDKRGRSVSITCVCFDITAMKKGAEHALIKLNEELLRSNNDLRQFAYVASHDLQEPLRMVSSFTQMLQQRYHDRLDDDAKEFIRFAVDGSKRMYELINGLLSYSRVQTGGIGFSRVRMDSVLEKVKQNLSVKIDASKAVIRISKLPVLFADENQMIQLFQNLIDNSLKFCSSSPEISISCVSDNEQYVFSVKDNGLGIESQYFERVFQIFQRLHKRGDYEGTGIGLAICKRIVERHGGSIRVESPPGEGCTFFFTIPEHQKINI
jgi:PAS domain S-box-containing protein